MNRKQLLQQCDIAVIGGGTGGVAAALAALRMGCRVVLSEETDWIGGQLTSQAVPPDENRWIEQFGGTRSYRRLREDIRDYYRRFYPLNETARQNPNLNPGNGWVSRLCHEPRVALAVLDGYLQPYISAGRLKVLLRHVPVAAQSENDHVKSVLLRDDDGDEVLVTAPYFLDATELGDLLELANIEHVIGAESQDETGEPHAVAGPAQPLNQQAVSHCFAISHHPGEDHTVDRPAQYDFWLNYQADFWPAPNLSWKQAHYQTLEPIERLLFDHEVPPSSRGLWSYRRILDASQFLPDFVDSDITIVNWPQMDYWRGPIVGISEEEAKQHREGAKQLSLSFLYWMQTDAPRPDGGTGYPGLKLRHDVVGSKDGLAKTVYVRESRRIRAEFTVLETHVGAEACPNGPAKFWDSVGIGCYRIDLHPSTNGVNYIDIGSWPFQIPLGSLLPQRVENLLPACKNLGVTHITNGCYRLHPVEWNIGEAAGLLAAHCLQNRLVPRQIRADKVLCSDFQRLLTQHGIELDWPQMTSV
jgi:hypothetical protein